MSLVVFSCEHSDGLTRIEKVIEEIEASMLIRLARGETRVIFEVGKAVLRIED